VDKIYWLTLKCWAMLALMPKKKKKARGRPYTGGPTPQRQLRMSDRDFARIKARAEAAGQTPSEWMREVLLKALGGRADE
jgi:hypothetical protein